MEKVLFNQHHVKIVQKIIKSGNIAWEKVVKWFTALAIKDGAEGTQTEGSWNLDPDGNKLKYEVEWLGFGALRLSKVDNTSEFQKNSKFRLISTSYTGYDETFECSQKMKMEIMNYLLIIYL